MTAGLTFQFDWEVLLIEWIQGHLLTHPLTVTLMSFFTVFAEPVTMILVIGFLYWSYDKKLGSHIALCLLSCAVFNCELKNLFCRRRPYFDHSGISCLKAVDSEFDIYDIDGQGFSLPSGHCVNVTSCVTSLYSHRKDRKILHLGSLLIFLVGFSRIALGVHYPTDVLLGILIGFLMTVLLGFLEEKLSKPSLYLVLTLLASAGLFYCRSNDYYASYGILIGYMAADLFESRHVQFRNTDNILHSILRVLLGGSFFLLISLALKYLFSFGLPFPLARILRYGISAFLTCGIYPLSFRFRLLD